MTFGDRLHRQSPFFLHPLPHTQTTHKSTKKSASADRFPTKMVGANWAGINNLQGGHSKKIKL
jgi:hypothetical protein